MLMIFEKYLKNYEVLNELFKSIFLILPVQHHTKCNWLQKYSGYLPTHFLFLFLNGEAIVCFWPNQRNKSVRSLYRPLEAIPRKYTDSRSVYWLAFRASFGEELWRECSFLTCGTDLMVFVIITVFSKLKTSRKLSFTFLMTTTKQKVSAKTNKEQNIMRFFTLNFFSRNTESWKSF